MDRFPINIADKLSLISERWSPKIIAQLNDYHVKIAKIKGSLDWHKHNETDELFLVIDGSMTIDFRESSVALRSGEMFIVPKGVEHRTRTEEECCIMMIEPSGTTKSGNESSDSGEWI